MCSGSLGNLVPAGWSHGVISRVLAPQNGAQRALLLEEITPQVSDRCQTEFHTLYGKGGHGVSCPVTAFCVGVQKPLEGVMAKFLTFSPGNPSLASFEATQVKLTFGCKRPAFSWTQRYILAKRCCMWGVEKGGSSLNGMGRWSIDWQLICCKAFWDTTCLLWVCDHTVLELFLAGTPPAKDLQYKVCFRQLKDKDFMTS